MKKIIILFLIASICLFPLASAVQTTFQISPSSEILEVGEIFNITITVAPGQEVDTIAVDLLQWNTGIIDCLSVQKGNLFDNPLIWMAGKINNTAGKLQYLVMASDAPTSQENSLCTITFQAKNEGISIINIGDSGVARNGTPLPKTILNSCQLTVGSAYILPPITNTTTNASQNQTTNKTEPVNQTPVNNETIMPPDGFDTDTPGENQTLIPIEANNTNINNTSNETISPGLFDSIPPTTIMYAIVAIIVISVFAYITIRHFQHRQEDKEDEESDDDQIYMDDDSGYMGDSSDVWG
jgi:hypothetical protein